MLHRNMAKLSRYLMIACLVISIVVIETILMNVWRYYPARKSEEDVPVKIGTTWEDLANYKSSASPNAAIITVPSLDNIIVNPCSYQTDRVLCQPQNNIVFLKTHKTGSSTIQNIFFRYGEKHNLTFALPKRSNIAGWPSLFHPGYLRDGVPKFKKYNIFAIHCRFYQVGLKEIMDPSSVYVTVLRNPVDQFVSIFNYFEPQIQKSLNITGDILSEFLAQPEYYFRPGKSFRLVKNPNLFDLGMPVEDSDNQTAVREKIRELDRIFDLVMITDFMEESLVLLRHLMCWDLEDIVYVNLNVGIEQKTRKNEAKEKAKAITDWNKADVALYEYFNATLWRRIREFGVEKMDCEVRHLRQATDKMYKSCLGNSSDATQPLKVLIRVRQSLEVNMHIRITLESIISQTQILQYLCNH
ncbi:galactosylceramide sulfotransferase-like [Ptychodera flava]|uniref:galactosylceramide sulfotransferase-like n=1 Tax=Ptychodera flava TaxID=63121 RepID=UPI00396A9380